jgi:hypothetical protein
VVAFVDDLMNPKDGLGNRAPAASGGFGYVSRVSWFSEFFFPSFALSNHTPVPFETRSSSLFNPFGSLSAVGEKFFGFCSAVAPAPPAPPTRPTAPVTVWSLT